MFLYAQKAKRTQTMDRKMNCVTSVEKERQQAISSNVKEVQG